MEIAIKYEPLSLDIVFELNDDRWRTLKGVKFVACGDDSGESLVVGLIRQARKVSTRKKALKVNGRVLTLRVPNKNEYSFILPGDISSRELKLLIQGRESYRHVEISAKVSWAKELILVAL